MYAPNADFGAEDAILPACDKLDPLLLRCIRAGVEWLPHEESSAHASSRGKFVAPTLDEVGEETARAALIDVCDGGDDSAWGG